MRENKICNQKLQGEKERLIKRLGVYYRQHMSGQNRRKEMLAILFLLDRSADETSETAQIGQDFEVEKPENVCIIKSDEFSESDHPRDENGQFTDGSGSSSKSNNDPKTGKSTRKITHFKTENGIMDITSDVIIKSKRSRKSNITLKAGSKIYNVYPFAGIGTNEPLVKAGTLAKQNGGAPDKWCHKAGYTVVSMGEKDFYAELHWFENDEVGQVGFKIKNRNKEE